MNAAHTLDRGRPWPPPLLSYGFRPFFALAAVAALLLPAGWLAMLAGHAWPGAPPDALGWHVHEMLYGFVSAAVGGFLLTAVPGFTGRPPLTGLPLAALALLWLAARGLAAFGGAVPHGLVIAADVGFLLLVGGVAARDIVRAGNRRNLVLVALVGLLALAALASHLGWQAAGTQPGLYVVALLITVLGGRIIPAFTSSWLRARGEDEGLPVRHGGLEVAVLVATAGAGLAHVLVAPPSLTAAAAVAAALLHALRLGGWRGWRVRREPLLLVLHAGYAWLVAGFALLALAALGVVAGAAVAHAFGMGAIGTMILAVMTRAALGHTGRPLQAPRAAVIAYLLGTTAALLRVTAALWPASWGVLVPAAGLAWMGAFAAFLAGYLPMLLRPRVA